MELDEEKWAHSCRLWASASQIASQHRPFSGQTRPVIRPTPILIICDIIADSLFLTLCLFYAIPTADATISACRISPGVGGQEKTEAFSVDFVLLLLACLCVRLLLSPHLLWFWLSTVCLSICICLPPSLLPLSAPSVEGDWGMIRLALKLLAPALTFHSTWAPAITKALWAAHYYSAMLKDREKRDEE